MNVPGTVTSVDGTVIAFECAGAGPAIVLVDPALGYRDFDNVRGLGERLAADFTVYTYDRRGRGRTRRRRGPGTDRPRR